MKGMNGCSRRSADSIAAKILRQAAVAADRVFAGELRLHPFDIPIAEVAPEKVVDHVRRFVEAEFFEGAIDVRGNVRETRKEPAINQWKRRSCRAARRVGCAIAALRRGEIFERRAASGFELLEIHKEKSRGVPNFVCEGARAENFVVAKNDVASRRGHAGQSEAHRVGSEFGGELQRIEAGALGFGHLLAFGVEHERVQVKLAEGNLSGEAQPHHDHARGPEEKNVAAGDERAGGVIFFEIGRFFRPAERGERPKAGAEPGVEHIRVLLDFRRAAFGASLRRFAADGDFLAIGAVPRGNAMAPPELARDAPVANVAHPFEINAFPILRRDLNFSRLHGFDGRLGQWLHLHEPLRGSARLDNRAAAVASADRVGVLDDFFEQAGGLQIGDGLIAGLEAIEAGIFSGSGAHVAVIGHDVDFGQLVAAADFEVVDIVRGRNFQSAGAELAIDVGVRDDGNFAIRERQMDHFADELLIALVLRVDGDSGIAQHRFRPGGGDDDIFLRPDHRIADVPEFPSALGVNGFQIADGRAAMRAPIDHVMRAINQPVFVQADESFANRA